MAAAEMADGEVAVVKGGGRKKLLLLAGVPLLLAGIGAGLWFSGILPKLLGMHPPAHAPEAQAASAAPVYLELPEIIANLNTGPRRTSFLKLKARLEVARAEDAAKLQAAMPRIMDLFQTYIREMRPEELRGSMGTYRLREELMARASLAAPPVQVKDVLFIEMIVQ